VSGLIETAIFERIAPRGIRHLRPVPYAVARGLVRDVYDQMRRDFQLVTPITLHAPVPELLAAVWSAGRESLVAAGGGGGSEVDSRAAREAVAAAVSRINACPFCTDVHAMMLHGAGAGRAAAILGSEDPGRVEDPALAPLVRWALGTGRPGSRPAPRPPFGRREAPRFIGTAVGFHYINRVVNVFLDASPFPLPPGLRGLRPLVARAAGAAVARRIARLAPEPGASLALLPEAELPADLAWAGRDPNVAGAFARLAAAVERAGASIPAAVRSAARARIEAWRGEAPGPGWLDRAVADLDEGDRPAARLVLLAALALHRVSDAEVAALRARGASDADLLALVAWAAFTAARRIGTWLDAPEG
jgi:AhpD family alkylhydroperoxidase